MPASVEVLGYILARLRNRLDGLELQDLRRADRLLRIQRLVASLTENLERLAELRVVMSREGPPEINQMPISVRRALRREVGELLLGGMVESGLELPEERRSRMQRGQ